MSLLTHSIFLQPKLIGKGEHRGGNVKYERLKTDVANLLHNKQAYCTPFFDFYGLHTSFPGKAQATGSYDRKYQTVCDALQAQIKKDLPNIARRFIPYVQMYEFEGLLFSHAERLARGIGQPELAPQFQAIRGKFNTPEEINDNYETKPSKRITDIHNRYNKVTEGNLAALEIGLPAIRQECALFDAWLTRLEQLKA